MDMVLEKRSEERITPMDSKNQDIEEQEVIEQSKKETAYIFSVPNTSRFNRWLKALKMRYWVDFGNQDEYKVDWIRKVDNDYSKEVVELIIKLYRVNNDNGDDSLLFTLTVFVSKQEIMVQGIHREFWKETEFLRLRDFVSTLSSSDEVNLSAVYTNTFKDRKDGEVLDLDKDGLDVLTVSDSEYVEEEQESHISQAISDKDTENNQLRYSGRKIRRSIRLFSPKKVNHSKNRPVKKIPSTEIAQQKLFESVQICLSRITELEDVVARVERLTTESELSLGNFKDTISSSLHGSLSDYEMKNEMSISRKVQESLLSEYGKRVCKVESELKRMQGRLGSLVEEKINLVTNVRALEDNNNVLTERIVSLEKQLMDGPSVYESTDCGVQTEVFLKDNATSGSLSRLQAEPSRNQQAETSRNLQAGPATNQEAESLELYDFVLLCDSNRKFLDASKLCPQNSIKIIPCGTTAKAVKIINSPRFSVRKGLLVNVGVNDVEHLTMKDTISKQVELANAAVNRFPEVKVIISGITPRDDDLDKVVMEVNAEVHRQISNLPNVIHVDNNNLRNRKFFYDHKHFNKRFGVPAFASNLKRSLRVARGSPFRACPGASQPQSPSPADRRSRHSRGRESNGMEQSPRGYSHPNSQGSDLLDINLQLKKLGDLMNCMLQTQHKVMFPLPVPPPPPGFTFPNVLPPLVN